MLQERNRTPSHCCPFLFLGVYQSRQWAYGNKHMASTLQKETLRSVKPGFLSIYPGPVRNSKHQKKINTTWILIYLNHGESNENRRCSLTRTSPFFSMLMQDQESSKSHEDWGKESSTHNNAHYASSWQSFSLWCALDSCNIPKATIQLQKWLVIHLYELDCSLLVLVSPCLL
jgi:hypothetical protein